MSGDVQTGAVPIARIPIRARHAWRFTSSAAVPAELALAAEGHGFGGRALAVVAARGIDTPDALRAFLADPLDGLHDPALLPDAALLVERIRLARERAEVVLVFGDFDADGLTGLAILARVLRALGLRAEPYVPSRLDEGHGLSLEAVRTAEGLGARLIVTVDTGSSSGREIGAAAERGIDVIVTDHHRVP
ncbi:MAG TPA: DHH family phosphoesterase, partial [Candidatus Limnocylindrales bacterium]|nr:DHH family phosphoesterase [Candidatus Limnocylindrales bacterium]